MGERIKQVCQLKVHTIKILSEQGLNVFQVLKSLILMLLSSLLRGKYPNNVLSDHGTWNYFSFIIVSEHNYISQCNYVISVIYGRHYVVLRTLFCVSIIFVYHVFSCVSVHRKTVNSRFFILCGA